MKKFALLFLVFSWALSAETVEVNKTVLATAKLFQVNLSYDPGAEGEILLNGLELGTIKKDGGSLSSNMAQYLVRKGMNRIEIKFKKGAKGNLKLRFHALAESGFPDDENMLFMRELPYPASSQIITFDFDLGDRPPATYFEKGEKIESLTAKDKKEIYSVYETVAKGLKTGNLKPVMPLLDFLMEEKARIAYMEKKEMVDSMEGMMKSERPKSVKVAPLAKMKFNIIGGNLLTVSAGGKAPVTMNFKDGKGELSYVFIKLNGKWMPAN